MKPFRQSNRLELSAWVLVAAQVAHGSTPAHTETRTLVGPLVGLGLLGASIVAGVGIHRARPWGPALLGWTGLIVAIGFALYHALPFTSAFTNPYFGKGVGMLPWGTVLLGIGAGTWAASTGLRRRAGL